MKMKGPMTTSEKPYRRPLLVAEIFGKAAELSGEPMKFADGKVRKTMTSQEKQK